MEKTCANWHKNMELDVLYTRSLEKRTKVDHGGDGI